MFFNLPVTGTKKRQQEAESKRAAAAAEAATRAAAEAAAEAASREAREREQRDAAAKEALEQQPADPLALFAVDSSCAYPSMRADYDATEAEYDAESRARMSTAPPMNNERVKRPTAVFISNLPANLTDQQLTEKFDCGVIREVFRIRDKSTREFNGCAVVGGAR